MSVYCCGKILETSFCPDCGTSVSDAKKEGNTPYPYQFDVYLHGDHGEGKDEIIEELGLDDRSDLAQDIIRCDYEVKLTYRIADENSKVKLIAVDGRELK